MGVGVIDLRGARFKIVGTGTGTCIGAGNSEGNSTSNKIGEIMIDNVDLICTHSEIDGVGIGAGRASGAGSTKVSRVSLTNSRVICDFAGGTCIGTGHVSENGTSEIREIVIEQSHIVQLGDGVGVGTSRAFSNTSSGAQSIVRALSINETMIEVSETGTSPGVGGSTAEIGSESIVSVLAISRSTLTGRGIWGDVKHVFLDRATVECRSSGGESCVKADAISVVDSIHGKTSTQRFFETSKREIGSELQGYIRYLIPSESEDLGLSLHFRFIQHPFGERFIMSIQGSGRHVRVEMNGTEDGLLVLWPWGGQVKGTYQDLPGHRLGRVTDSTGGALIVGNGTVFIDGPLFQSGTEGFTHSHSPYRRTMIRPRRHGRR
jgi:hypothetical protein